MYPISIMRRLPAQIRRWIGVFVLLVVAVFIAAPRGVCLAAVLSDGSCCRVAASASKACCRMGAGCCTHDEASESDDDASVPLSESAACPNNSPDELPTPVRHAPDLEMQAVVCILPALVSVAGLSVARHPAQLDAARSTAPLLRMNCILRI